MIDLGPLILINDTFNSFDSSKEYQCMLEALIFLEVDHFCVLGRLLITNGQLQVIAVLWSRYRLIRTFIKYILYFCCNTYSITPVKIQFILRLIRAHNCARVD